MMRCYLCDALSECRPYGPKGQGVCFSCAMSPEQKGATEMMFGKTLDACGEIVVIDDNGARPGTSKEMERILEGKNNAE